jgi:hypothetical protein
MTPYDPLEAARAARMAKAAQAEVPPAPPAPVAVRDPLPYCIYATVSLIAWLVSPPLAVAFFAGLGLRQYWRAYRAGLRESDCILGDPRRVMAYLGLLMVAGLGVTLWQLGRIFF